MKKKTLIAACGAHVVQDGLVALQYVLLPIIASLFNLSYAQVGFLRAVGHTMMSALEIPAGFMAARLGERRLLAFGLVCAGLGYLGIAFAPGFFAITVCLAVAGLGAGFQHSISSSLIVKSYDFANRRKALGTYNSSGDAGKLVFTGLFSAGIGMGLAWNAVLAVLAGVSVGFGVWVWRSLRNREGQAREIESTDTGEGNVSGWGIKNPRRFVLLGVIVFLDSLVQAVFLTFLAFVMLGKGMPESVASASVVIALVGGMAGKFVSGVLATRFGDRLTFMVLQLLTVVGIVLLVTVPGMPLLFLLPLIGLAIQGTSTVTYGSVSEFVDHHAQSRGYALVYTVSSVSTVFGPFLFGLLADLSDLATAMWMVALVAVLALPLCGALSPRHPVPSPA